MGGRPSGMCVLRRVPEGFRLRWGEQYGTFGTNILTDNWYAWNCGKNNCTVNNYTTKCIPTYYDDDDGAFSSAFFIQILLNFSARLTTRKSYSNGNITSATVVDRIGGTEYPVRVLSTVGYWAVRTS